MLENAGVDNFVFLIEPLLDDHEGAAQGASTADKK